MTRLSHVKYFKVRECTCVVTCSYDKRLCRALKGTLPEQAISNDPQDRPLERSQARSAGQAMQCFLSAGFRARRKFCQLCPQRLRWTFCEEIESQTQEYHLALLASSSGGIFSSLALLILIFTCLVSCNVLSSLLFHRYSHFSLP